MVLMFADDPIFRAITSKRKLISNYESFRSHWNFGSAYMLWAFTCNRRYFIPSRDSCERMRVQSLVESVSECKICRVYPIGIKYSVRRYVRRISMQSVWAYIHWLYIRHLHGTRALVGVSARPHSRARERLHIWNEDVNVVVLSIDVSHESRTNGSAIWLREINFFTRECIE